MKFVYISEMDEIENLFKQSDFSSENRGLESRIWNRLMEHHSVELTKEQAQAYLDELEDVELDKETLDKVAGGGHNPGACQVKKSQNKSWSN